MRHIKVVGVELRLGSSGDFVSVGEPFEALHGGFGRVGYEEVVVQQSVEGHLAFSVKVVYFEFAVQCVGRKRHSVREHRFERPYSFDLGLLVGAKLERYSNLVLVVDSGCGGRDRPVMVTRETMLAELRDDFGRVGVVCRSTEDRNTRGIPPRIAALPSRAAFDERNNRSLPPDAFHEVTVAPKKRTSAEAFDFGSSSCTVVLSLMMLTGIVGGYGIG